MELTENNQVNPDITTLNRDPKRGFRHWTMSQIYMGKEGKNLVVPNVGDVVDDIAGGIIRFKTVVAVDESTLIPTFETLTLADDNNEDDNQFRGVGPGYQSETWRIFYDDRVVPHTLMVDANLHAYGEDATYMKIFKGRDTTSTGRVISQYRTNNTDSFSENVPLVKIGNRFDDSPAIKRPMVCHTTERLHVGDVVTAVTYTASGKAFSENVLIVANATNVRALDEATAYVSGIELISPFISPSDDRLLEFPSNIAREGLFTMGRVNYSDGTSRMLAIDGGRMSIIGLGNYISTLAGETNSFALDYQLADNELAWNAEMGEGRGITEIYRYRTLEVDGSYSVSLVCVPVWKGDTQGWDLQYYLYNIDRDIYLDVTDKVEVGATSDMFNGRSYGRIQHINVALELSKLDLGLNAYRHVQNFEIGLSGSPLLYDSPYIIQYHNNQNPGYGRDVKVKLDIGTPLEAHFKFNEFLQIGTVEEFLERTVYQTKPVFNERIESKAPTPTHFTVTTPDNVVHEYPLDMWNQEIVVPTSERYPFKDGSTVLVGWLRKVSPTVTQHITMTPMVARLS